MAFKKALALSILTLTTAFNANTAQGGEYPAPVRQEKRELRIGDLPDVVKVTLMNDYARMGMMEPLFAMIDVEKFNVNLADEKGVTPLMAAAQSGQMKIATGLLSRGADKNMKDKIKGLTAAEWAQISGHSNAAMLIETFDPKLMSKPPQKNSGVKP